MKDKKKKDDQQVEVTYLKKQKKKFHQDEPYVLCWGHKSTGNFPVKEAYVILAEYDILPSKCFWKQV